MSRWSAPSDYDYYDEVNPPEHYVMQQCRRCGDVVQWAISQGEPPRPFRCPSCTEQIQKPTDHTRARTEAIINISCLEYTTTRKGSAYWRCFGQHGLEAISLGTYQRDHAERLQQAQAQKQPALVTWGQRVRFDHPILKVIFPVPIYE